MICMKKLRFSSGPSVKVGHQGPPGSARAQPSVWRKIMETTHSLQFDKKKSKHKFLDAMYPTAMLSPRKEGEIGWEIRQIDARNKHCANG